MQPFEEAAAQRAKTLNTLNLIWMAMLASIAMYGFVLESRGDAGLDLGGFASDSTIQALTACAVAMFAGSWLILPLLTRNPIPLAQAATESARIGAALGRLAVAKVLQYALIEGGTLMGFAGAFIRQNRAPYYVLAIVGIALLILARPTAAEIEKAARI